MQQYQHRTSFVRIALVVIAAFVLTGCASMIRGHIVEHKEMHGGNPPLELTLAPTYTPTAQAEEAPAETPTVEAPTEVAPTAIPTEDVTPEPVAEEAQQTASATASPAPTVAATVAATATATRPQPTATSRARPAATATPKPTPIVVIPNGFTKQTDSVRGYSLAFPRGYTLLDLRSAQFRNLAGAVGMGDQMATLNDFLDSDAGQIVGILAASDLPGMIFGGLPTIAQVTVVDATGANQDTAQASIRAILTGPGAILSNPVIETIENVTINNLPGVRAKATGSLPGANRPMTGKVVGLLANDKFYVLMQLTESTKFAAKEPIFDQIIGTFRPE